MRRVTDRSTPQKLERGPRRGRSWVGEARSFAQPALRIEGIVVSGSLSDDGQAGSNPKVKFSRHYRPISAQLHASAED
jgi:hypothetical protein